MKQSNWILSILAVSVFISLVVTNVILKKSYLEKDKNNPFWNYEMLQTGRFSHVKVEDARSTWVVFQPSANTAVGVLSEMAGQKRVETRIADDTLYIKIIHRDDPPGIADWLSRNQLVCVTAPVLLSVTGSGLAMEMKYIKQPNLTLSLSGDSRMSVETVDPHFDTLSVDMKDSCQVKIQLSKNLFSSGTIAVKTLKARVSGKSLFDASQLLADSLDQQLDNVAAIALNGSTLGKINH